MGLQNWEDSFFLRIMGINMKYAWRFYATKFLLRNGEADDNLGHNFPYLNK